jgi:hypothetical protein
MPSILLQRNHVSIIILHKLLVLLLCLSQGRALAEGSVSISLDGAALASHSSESRAISETAASSPFANDTNMDATIASSALLPLECGIWLAPSTIPGAGLGLYAGRRFQTDEPLQANGDLVLNIIDLRLHTKHFAEMESFLWDEYTWSADALNVRNVMW